MAKAQLTQHVFHARRRTRARQKEVITSTKINAMEHLLKIIRARLVVQLGG